MAVAENSLRAAAEVFIRGVFDKAPKDFAHLCEIVEKTARNKWGKSWEMRLELLGLNTALPWLRVWREYGG